MFCGIGRILVPRIFPENTNLFGIFDPETRKSLSALNSGVHPRQCDNDGLRSRAVCVRRHAENDLEDLRSDFNPLNERADYVSTAMPVGVGQMRPDCDREIAKTFRRKSQVFQLVDIACVILLWVTRGFCDLPPMRASPQPGKTWQAIARRIVRTTKVTWSASAISRLALLKGE
jgi:hypothetical protein